MTVTLIITLVMAMLIILLAFEVPVALALAFSGGAGLVALKGFGYADNMLGSVPFTTTSSFSLTIVPMFILMGVLAVKARVAEQVFKVAAHVCRRIPGGLGVATVMACAGFAAVSGSSVGTSAIMSRLSVNEMRRFGYSDSMASGIVAVAGTLGILIPPSVMLVLYAIITGESVGIVLLAGIVPGIISAIAYMIYIMVAARKVGSEVVASAGGSLDSALVTVNAGNKLARESASAGRKAASTSQMVKDSHGLISGGSGMQTSEPVVAWRALPWRGVVRVGILFAVVLGGMYSGIFTATESAAMGAITAAIILIVELRKSPRKILTAFTESLREGASTTSMIFFIVVGSAILSTFFVAARVPESISKWIGGLDLPPMAIMGLMLLMLIPLGMVLESMSILVITTPLLYPVALEMGFDGVWLAIVIVKLIEIGLVTPPVGLNCFVVSATSGVRVERVFKGVLPFVLVDICVTALFFFFPAIVLWLPSMAAAQ